MDLEKKQELVRQRIMSGMTQRQAAQESKLTETVVRRIERGDPAGPEIWRAYESAVKGFIPTPSTAAVPGRVSAAIRRFMSGGDVSIGLDLGRYVDEYRTSLNLNHEGLAEILGIGAYRIHAIIHGKMNLAKAVTHIRQYQDLMDYVSSRAISEENAGVLALFGISQRKAASLAPSKTVAATASTTLDEILTSLDVKTTATITVTMVDGTTGTPVYLIQR